MESPDSDCAAASTCEDADPVSLAPRCTSPMLEDTCWVPIDACCTLREISCVAAPCCSTAAAMVDEISDSLSMVVYAGQSNVALPGAQLRRLAVTANAAKVAVDASAASVVSNVSGTVRVGMLSVDLPDGDLVGTFRVGGGRLQLCAPSSVGLRVNTSGFPKEVTVEGAHVGGSGWESQNYASAAHRADLQVNINFGSVEINPTGGCR